MRFKKAAAILLASVMAVTSFAGCGSQAADTSEGKAGNEKTATENAKEGKKKKLTVTTWDNDISPQFRLAVETFQEKFPDVEVEIIDTAANEYNNKLTVMLASGDADPDVIFVKDMGSQLSMQAKGQILNLDEYIKKDNLDMSIYNNTAEKLQIDGSYYTLPYRSDWYILFYNKDLFDKAGVPYPSNDMTWEEYEELARKMTSGEGSEKVFGTHNHIWMGLVCNWAIQDGKHTLVADDYSFLKPYYEQAIRMQDEGIIQNYATLKTGNLHYTSVFQQQQCAMMPMGTWFIANMIQAQKSGETDFNWGFATIPHPEDVEAGNSVGAVTPIAINAKTDEPDLAWEFVKCATSEETAEKLAENGMLTAVQNDTIMDKLVTTEGFPKDCKDALLLKGMVFDRPLDKNIEAIRKAIEEEHDLIMIGEQDVDTGLEHMAERVKEVKENNK